MDRYDAKWKDLAPRDVVARSIHSEMLRRGVPNVYLDLRSATFRPSASAPSSREMYRSCLEYGIDITRDLLPVVPAAHYSCGGVWVDERRHDDGRSAVRGRRGRRAPGCTAPTGSRARRCSRAWSGAIDRRGTSCASWRARDGAALRRHPALAGRPARETPDPALIAQDMSSLQAHHVELRRPGAHDAPPGARDPGRCATSKSRSSASIARRR